MKFRKKPVIVDAFRFDIDFMPQWFLDACNEKSVSIMRYDSIYEGKKDYAMIHMEHGSDRASQGDYVIREPSGEIHSCKPDIFKETYGPAE